MGEIRAAAPAPFTFPRGHISSRETAQVLSKCARNARKQREREIRVMLNLSANRKRKRSRKRAAFPPSFPLPPLSHPFFVEMGGNRCDPNRAAIDIKVKLKTLRTVFLRIIILSACPERSMISYKMK